jgi:hypothetical protein
VNGMSENQKAFIERLKRAIDAEDGAEIIQNSMEDFKNIVREEITFRLSKKVSKVVSGKSIYLVHDLVDTELVTPYKEEIEKSGFRILAPSFNGDLLDLRKKHNDNLQNFDGAIIFKGKVSDQWVQMKILDLLKSLGLGRKKSIKGTAIIGTGNLDAFKNQNVTVIQGNTERSVETLRNFLKSI